MSKNKTGKYLKYAIGEILLVMIGILLALQVNNWNETRKERALELEYLEGIRADLENDLPYVENRLRVISSKLSALHEIDTTFAQGRPEIHNVSLDTIKLRWLFNRGAFTRLTTGSYTALITNASAGLIKNKELLKSIQHLYEIRYPANQSIYDDIKRREEYIGLKYAKDYKTSNIQDFFILNPNREEVLADFHFYYRQQGLLYGNIQSNRNLIIQLIEDINKELIAGY